MEPDTKITIQERGKNPQNPSKTFNEIRHEIRHEKNGYKKKKNSSQTLVKPCERI
jgi:hypothetical protein